MIRLTFVRENCFLNVPSLSSLPRYTHATCQPTRISTPHLYQLSMQSQIECLSGTSPALHVPSLLSRNAIEDRDNATFILLLFISCPDENVPRSQAYDITLMHTWYSSNIPSIALEQYLARESASQSSFKV